VVVRNLTKPAKCYLGRERYGNLRHSVTRAIDAGAPQQGWRSALAVDGNLGGQNGPGDYGTAYEHDGQAR